MFVFNQFMAEFVRCADMYLLKRDYVLFVNCMHPYLDVCVGSW